MSFPWYLLFGFFKNLKQYILLKLEPDFFFLDSVGVMNLAAMPGLKMEVNNKEMDNKIRLISTKWDGKNRTRNLLSK